MTQTPPRILIIAGSDSGGGAGIQADIKTVTMLGGYAMTAITAITAQNTLGVHGVEIIPASMIAQQIDVVAQDIGIDAIKIGMLGNIETIHTVAECLIRHRLDVPVMLDPVMQAKGGSSLLMEEAEEALATDLLPFATCITPNIPEAERLTGLEIKSLDDMKHAASVIAARCVPSVLVTGGHAQSERIHDVLYDNGEYSVYSASRLDSVHTHGTGCTLASALTTLLARGVALPDAIPQAQHFIHHAIAYAPEYGAGHGPMWHGWAVEHDKP